MAVRMYVRKILVWQGSHALLPTHEEPGVDADRLNAAAVTMKSSRIRTNELYRGGRPIRADRHRRRSRGVARKFYAA